MHRSDYAEINLKGLKGSAVTPPSLPHDETSEIECPLPEPADNPEDLKRTNAKTEETEAIKDSYCTGHVEGWILNNISMNRTEHVIYDYWYTSTKTWYNKKLDEYCVLFSDLSEDCFKKCLKKNYFLGCPDFMFSFFW